MEEELHAREEQERHLMHAYGIMYMGQYLNLFTPAFDMTVYTYDDQLQ